MSDDENVEPDDDRDIETIVFESLGEVSVCWDPRPDTQVFDSTRVRAVGDRLLTEIRARIVGDRTDELIAERNRLRNDVVSLRMLLTETTAERDQLQDERDVFRDQALPEAATIMNGLSAALIETKAERDRLRARVLELVGQAGDRERLLRDVLKDMRDERDRLRAALRAVMTETGTSSLAHHYARDALDGSEETTDG